jgi:enoyl-CoA hydratase/carnithine racemase
MNVGKHKGGGSMEAVLFEVKERTAHIKINRPHKRNAINVEVRKGLKRAWEQVNEDPEIYSAIITGDDKVFSVGQDLGELSEFRKKEPVGDLPLNTEEIFGGFVNKPLIAAINGYCLGAGLLLVLNSDFRIAGDTVVFGLPEVKVAVPTALDLPPKIAQNLPKVRAMEMLLLGEFLHAETAYHIGFINRIVEPTQVMAVAEEFASKINELSPFMTRLFKEQYQTITSLPPQVGAFSKTLAKLGRYSEDYREGPRAFAEKRKPVWKSK